MDPYKVLGISPNATDEEVKNAYRTLARKYHPDNYAADNPLAELATEKMKEINEAYDQIQRMRQSGNRAGSQGGQNSYQSGGQYTGGSGVYAEIRIMLNNGRFGDAEKRLQEIPEGERTADWHFLSAVVLMRRGWSSDAMRELEIACEMDPQNQEYQKAKEMFNDRRNAFGRTYYGDGYGKRAGECDSCDFCTSLLCMQCLCNSMRC